MKEELDGRIATYERGLRRTDRIGRSELPLLAVYPRVTRESRSGTGNDRAEYEVGIRVTVTSALEPNQPRTAQVAAQERLEDILEGRDASGKARSNTVIGALNGNITLDGTALYTDSLVIAYDTEYEAQEVRETATVLLTVHDRPER